MIVLKFGGTSVGSAGNARNVVEIVRSRLDRKPVVVVSALSGVTDVLYRIAGGENVAQNIAFLRKRHLSLLEELVPEGILRDGVNEKLQMILDSVESSAVGGISERGKAYIISSGELMSSTIMAAALCASGIATAWADARGLIIASGDPMKAQPELEEINERVPQEIGEAFAQTGGGISPDAVITQGFICASASGKSAVLGRGGSDYSASLIGAALNAEAVEIWTDVDGVRTADPRRVPTTKCLRRISYEEAAEMAHFGAKVLHPLTLEPAKTLNIPVYVLNTANPDGECTVILNHEQVHSPVKSVSYKVDILVISMRSKLSIDTSGFIKKIFDVFSENRIDVDLVSTNNAWISVTVDASQKYIDKALERIGEFADVLTDDRKSQISAIGSNATVMSSILKMTFAPLRDSKIYMISPGASSVNISFVVDRERLNEILCQTHKYLIEDASGD